MRGSASHLEGVFAEDGIAQHVLKGCLAAAFFEACEAQVGSNHFGDKLGKRRAVTPAELFAGFARVALQMVDLCRPVIDRVDADESLARAPVLADFVNAFAGPYNLPARYA